MFYEDEEDQGQELPGENEDLQEHKREKDTHRKRRIQKEKEKQKKEQIQLKPKGKRPKFDREWDDDFDF